MLLSIHIPKSNPEPNNISDQQTVSEDKGKMLVLTAEGYNKIKQTVNLK